VLRAYADNNPQVELDVPVIVIAGTLVLLEKKLEVAVVDGPRDN
jgi:hypothetical protein